jgi:hypothetical protein
MEEIEYNGARIEEGKGRRRDPFGSLLLSDVISIELTYYYLITK